MSVDQSRQERLLAKIDNFTGDVRFDLIEFPYIENLMSANNDHAIVDGRSIHRHDSPCTMDHSAFTIFRHSATNRLHAS